MQGCQQHVSLTCIFGPNPLRYSEFLSKYERIKGIQSFKSQYMQGFSRVFFLHQRIYYIFNNFLSNKYVRILNVLKSNEITDVTLKAILGTVTGNYEESL